MFCRTDAIVLRNKVYAEADLIVTYFTKDFGILSALAKSPRKSKSRFGSSLEPLSMCRLTLYGKEQTALPKITQSDIIRSFQSIRDNYKLLLNALDLTELNFYFLPERQKSEPLFELLHWLLLSLETNPTGNVTTLLYKLLFLKYVGHLPLLQSCGRCTASSLADKEGLFFYTEGSVLCRHCLTTTNQDDLSAFVKVSKASVYFFASILKWDLSKVHRVKAHDSIVQELNRLVDGHIRYLTSGRYKPVSASFLNPS